MTRESNITIHIVQTSFILQVPSCVAGQAGTLKSPVHYTYESSRKVRGT